MKLAIDARSLSTRPSGVGHYLMAAVNIWSELQPDWTFELLSHRPLHDAALAALRRRSNVLFHQMPTRWLSGNGLWWLLTGYEAAALLLNADALWGAGGVLPKWRRLPALLTVHDLVYLSLPQTMSWRSRIAYTALAGSAIRSADWLWCVSAFTAGEVRRHYPKRRSNAITIGSGLNPVRARPPTDAEIATVRQRYALNERVLLFVGTVEPRKNLCFLLGLMRKLAPLGFKLIVVGCSGWGRTDLAAQIHSRGFPTDAVHFCDFLPDQEIAALYRAASLFVSTSLMEGFGLPQLEAMAAGLPVVAAANSALPEVVGDGGVLVHGWSEATWVDAILQATSNRPALQARALIASRLHAMAPACAALSEQLARQAT